MTHGLYSTYVQGCRCVECKQANATYHQQLRLSRKPELARNHGTTATYSNYRCRCDLCTGANSHYYQGLRARRQQDSQRLGSSKGTGSTVLLPASE